MNKIVQLALLIGIIGASAINAMNAKGIGRKESPKIETTARQISEAADTVQEAIKNVQMAPVAEKAMARQEANDAVENLLATLHERTWTGDLRGYTQNQVKEAGQKLVLLDLEKEKVIKEITAQETKVAEMTDTKFWGLWSSAKEGMTEERDAAMAELNRLKKKLTRINNALRHEEMIAGKAYSLAIKRATIIIGLAAATVGAVSYINYLNKTVSMWGSSWDKRFDFLDPSDWIWWLRRHNILEYPGSENWS